METIRAKTGALAAETPFTSEEKTVSDIFKSILEESRSIEPWLVATRRELHRIPEPGNEERETSAAIGAILDQLEISHVNIGTGVVGLLDGPQPGKCVALRADMDALPIEEPAGRPYTSLHHGYMHACGHDAHMTVALGVAKLLTSRRADVRGSVKFLFQPAEESTGGAKPMIEAGCLENPHVDYVLGLHVAPELASGKAAFRSGPFYGASDNLEIIVRGLSAHGAHPEQGIDAIYISAQIIQALQSVVSRSISPLDSAVITIGKIQGGTRNNIIASEVVLTGTIRTLSEDVRAFLRSRITELCARTAEALGGSCETRIQASYPVLSNHALQTTIVREIAERILGSDNVRDNEKPTLGVEDFAYFLRERPGTFWHLGCGKGGESAITPLHSSGFDIDESCLAYGVAVQTASALSLLKAGTYENLRFALSQRILFM